MIRDLTEAIGAVMTFEGHGAHGPWPVIGGVIACRCGGLCFELEVLPS